MVSSFGLVYGRPGYRTSDKFPVGAVYLALGVRRTVIVLKLHGLSVTGLSDDAMLGHRSRENHRVPVSANFTQSFFTGCPAVTRCSSTSSYILAMSSFVTLLSFKLA